MNILTETRRYTPEDLLALPGGDRYELIDGQLVEPKMSLLSSFVGGELYGAIRDHCKANKSGWFWPADAQFRCFPHAPNRVRKPDAAFIRTERLGVAQMVEGMARIAPDLV